MTAAWERDVLALLRELVAIDSVNPSLIPGAAGEGEVAHAVAAWARAAGLAATITEPSPGRPSVVVRSGMGGDGRRLLLCGHLDTVGTGSMHAPFVPRIDGDRMYGRGTYDMKAGLAAALVACREAHRRGLDGEVVVAAVADEEHASLGIQDVLDHLDVGTIDGAIVTEPTELTVGVAHRGFVWQRIDVTGRAAHGSRPHLGVDAILGTGPILTALRAFDRDLATRSHPLLGAGNLHASLIEGGQELSTIPDRCRLSIERRTLPGETAAQVEADLAALLDRCRRDDPDLEVTATTLLVRDPLETPTDDPLVTTSATAVHDAIGQAPTVGGMSYWADSAFLSAVGIPTVLFGPDGDGAHAEVEWVSLAGTVACTRALIGTAARFCTQPPEHRGHDGTARMEAEGSRRR